MTLCEGGRHAIQAIVKTQSGEGQKKGQKATKIAFYLFSCDNGLPNRTSAVSTLSSTIIYTDMSSSTRIRQ